MHYLCWGTFGFLKWTRKRVYERTNGDCPSCRAKTPEIRISCSNVMGYENIRISRIKSEYIITKTSAYTG